MQHFVKKNENSQTERKFNQKCSSGFRRDTQSNHHRSVQTKATYTTTNDRYECEADRIASDIVMKQSSNHTVSRALINRLDHPTAIHANHNKNTTIPVRVDTRPLQSSAGKPLGDETKAYFESRLTGDFNKVRIHSDAAADKVAHSLNARAFTVNNHICFASGQFQPNSDSGRKLLAHELVHVLQQGHGDKSVGTTSSVPQNATMNPQIGRRRASVINTALDRVPDVVRSAAYVLGRYLSGTETMRQYLAVVMGFGIRNNQPGWQALVNSVINTYNTAQVVLQSPRCLISYDPNLAAWGQFSDAPQGNFTWEITVGRDFYTERISRERRRLLGRFAGRASTNLLRTLTMIHEAVHCIHGGGHSSQPPICNPYMYEKFILEIRFGSGVSDRFQGIVGTTP